MCGIVGIYSLKNEAERSNMLGFVDAMQKSLEHRGPDAHDVWQDNEFPVAFGHRRLAIIDISDDGRQPMASPSGRYVITYNGEIYNYLELKKELECLGQTFKTKSDTEVLLAAIENWGFEKTLNKVNGMFAFAIWDKNEKKLFLARDRFGKKPLYVGWAGNDFLFASELKAFHVHDEFKGELDRNSLAIYMQYSYMHAPYSIFKNVWQLNAGSYAILDFENIKTGCDISSLFKVYWDLPSKIKSQENLNIDENDAVDEFQSILENSVKQRMLSSDVPLGALLSGGVDSSSIVALMQKISASPVKTFSIGFKEEEYNEADSAKSIANYLGTDHHEFYVSDKDALNVIPILPNIYDEPFADSSQIPTYLISKLAKEHVTVALTGDGGDEILGGYERYTHVAYLWDKLKSLPYPLRKSIAPLLQYFLKSSNSKLGKKIYRSASLMNLKDGNEIYHNLISAWSNGENVVLDSKIPSLLVNNQENWFKDLSFAENMMLSDSLSYRTDDLMVKSDRASMAVALELRAPLMDYKLAEFCWQLPQSMKIKGLQGKWLLRQVMNKYIPTELTDRPKQHFGIPLDEWLKGSLKEWGSDLLSYDRLKKQNLFDADLVYNAWVDYQDGNKNAVSSKAIWTALMFQTWSDRWL